MDTISEWILPVWVLGMPHVCIEWTVFMWYHLPPHQLGKDGSLWDADIGVPLHFLRCMDVLEILMQSYTSKIKRWQKEVGGVEGSFLKAWPWPWQSHPLLAISYFILFYFSRKEGVVWLTWTGVSLETAPAPVFSFYPPWVALRAPLWSAYCVLGPFMCIIS